ncbi:MAG: hypothetical protein IJK28_00205 [Clostridia bacterium]|nr:hypothetical protein [Clostridia bacterium]
MRCSCKECGTWMVQADSDRLGCVCTVCGYRCRDCLGTDTVVSRENLRSLAFDPRFSPDALAANFTESDDEDGGDPGDTAGGADEWRKYDAF